MSSESIQSNIGDSEVINLISSYKQHIIFSLENAEKFTSKLNADILHMDGMTGQMTRHFYNNLLNYQDARYLEIGAWKGSSVCSAMYKNNATVVCIDNWCEFGGPKNEFLINFELYKGHNNAAFIEHDCFKLDVKSLPKFNMYMYDGNHSIESQYKALTHYIDCLDDIFIYVVDDWHCSDVREGTMKAIIDLKLELLFEKDIRLPDNRTPEYERATWWNGMYVAILKK